MDWVVEARSSGCALVLTLVPPNGGRTGSMTLVTGTYVLGLVLCISVHVQRLKSMSMPNDHDCPTHELYTK